MYLGGDSGTRRAGNNSEVDLTKVDGAPVSLGQKVADASIPVVLASDQSLTLQGGTFTPAAEQVEDTPHVTGHTGSFVLGVRNDADAVRTSADGDYSPVSVDSAGRLKTVGPLTDTQLRAAAVPVSGTVAVSNSDFPDSTAQSRIGALTETAPATDTASSGLNGRLQRIAQHLTSLIALLPSSLGQKTKAGSLAVTLASDQDALPVTDNGGSLTVDGTFWQATQPISAASLPLPTGAATEASLGTDGTAPPAVLGGGTGVRGWLRSIYEKLTGTIAVTGPLTDAQLRATPVPVSGTVTATTGGLTDAQLRASAVPTTDNAAEFWRIKNKRFTNSEEVRYDIPASLISASIYTGVAADGTATSATGWTVIRTYFDATGNPSRERIRINIVWDNRTSGWT